MLSLVPFDEEPVEPVLSILSPEKEPKAEYHATVHDIPPDDRPRERLQQYGADTLATSELLAIILRTGTPKENVLELSIRLLAKYGGLVGLMSIDFQTLSGEHGL